MDNNMETTVIKPAKVKNKFYHLAGWVILFLNKIRHAVQGYTRPRPFPVTEVDKAIEQDLMVLGKYKEALGKDFFSGKTVLDLGPGADLGVGLALLAGGAKSYTSLDINNLITKAPAKLYEKLFTKLQEQGLDKLDKFQYDEELSKAIQGQGEKLNYVVRKDFSVAPLKGKGIDTVISHHAFEHFDDLETLFKELEGVVMPGGRFIAEVDLQTHTRWIREADPLNIYRYSKGVYNLFRFSGSPNRVRPKRYKELLETYGWEKVEIIPVVSLEKGKVDKVAPSLHGDFASENDLHILAFLLLATKSK